MMKPSERAKELAIVLARGNGHGECPEPSDYMQALWILLDEEHEWNRRRRHVLRALVYEVSNWTGWSRSELERAGVEWPAVGDKHERVRAITRAAAEEGLL